MTGFAAPAQAVNKDPEQAYTDSVRGTADRGDWLKANNRDAQSTIRALVSSVSANRRIAAKLPSRSKGKAIGSKLAVDVVDVESGKRIWGYRSTATRLPASNMKIVTAANALTVLGPNKRYVTTVVSRAKGEVAIIGSGDATLSMSSVTTLAKETKEYLKLHPELAPDSGKPLKVFVDDSAYPAPTQPAGWTNSYQPYVVRPVRALGMDGRYTWDSAKDTAEWFRKKIGGKTSYAGRTDISHLKRFAEVEPTVLASHTGASVADQVIYMLQVSENNIAEMLYRNVAVARGKVANWTNSRDAAIATLKELKVPTAGLQLRDGSGVGRNDRLTTHALTTLLRRVADSSGHPKLHAIYYGHGLPLAGRSGTLASSNGRFNTNPTKCARGKLRAKTGTLFDTVALSGLTVGRDGKLKAFSIMVNKRPQKYSALTTRRAIDKIAATVNGCY